jgi:hypothetical protein
MRGFFQFAIVAVIIFFGVGEWRGWNVGVMPQTPLFLYKTTSSSSTVRRLTGSAPGLEFSLSGQLSRGSMRMVVSFERPDSVQNPANNSVPLEQVYEVEFFAGQPIVVAEFLDLGTGFYRFRLFFNDATGRVGLDLPTSYEAGSQQ